MFNKATFRESFPASLAMGFFMISHVVQKSFVSHQFLFANFTISLPVIMIYFYVDIKIFLNCKICPTIMIKEHLGTSVEYLTAIGLLTKPK